MSAMFRQGVRSSRRRGGPHTLRFGLAAVMAGGLLLSAVAAPAAASVLYRCTSAGGVMAYVSHTKGYHACVKIGQWPAATPSAHPIEAAERSTSSREKPRTATVLPGTPPRTVKANPAILKVTPLGDGDVVVRKPAPARAWQPVPVAALDALGSWILPRLLDVDAAPVHAPPPKMAPKSSAAPSAPPLHATVALRTVPDRADGGAREPDAPHGTASARRPPRRGAVYRVVQKNGTVLYTNVASLARGHNARQLFTYIIECYACNVHSKIDWNTVPLRLAAYRGDIVAAAKLTGVDPALLRAVIHAESGFNPRALSYKGAQGLMQLMPATAFELGVGDAFDPAENISGGARYLASLLHAYQGDVKLAAAAYNAGAGAVSKYGGVPPYAETRVYVKRVALLYQRYRKALAAHGGPALATATIAAPGP